jgi:hypothetical protein
VEADFGRSFADDTAAIGVRDCRVRGCCVSDVGAGTGADADAGKANWSDLFTPPRVLVPPPLPLRTPLDSGVVAGEATAPTRLYWPSDIAGAGAIVGSGDFCARRDDDDGDDADADDDANVALCVGNDDKEEDDDRYEEEAAVYGVGDKAAGDATASSAGAMLNSASDSGIPVSCNRTSHTTPPLPLLLPPLE